MEKLSVNDVIEKSTKDLAMVVCQVAELTEKPVEEIDFDIEVEGICPYKNEAVKINIVVKGVPNE